MEIGPFQILSIAVIIIYMVHVILTKFNFWKERGIKNPKPNIFFGNIKDVMFMKLSLGEYVKRLYMKYPDEPFVGFYIRSEPVLIINDLDNIKDVLIKDFSVFPGRGIEVNTKAEPLLEHLFLIGPEKWRPLRSKLSPVFTSGKLKEMFYIIIKSAETFDEYTESIVSKGEPIDVRDLASRYTTDVIGSCAFGLDMNALSDEECEFRKWGKKIFQMDALQLVRFWMARVFPKIYNALWWLFYRKDMTDFFVNSLKQTIQYREKNNVRRNDFVDLLRDIRDHPDKVNNIEMTDTLLAAQAFVFFGAGFETSSTTISNALYELAQHKEIQEKLRQEIKDEFNKNNGVLKYESIKNMPYLHKVFQETLRKYPVAHVLNRESNAPYTFSSSKLTIPERIRIFIPVYGIHYDSRYYPDPETFDPERFEEDVIKSRHPMSYLPFGDGPRNCIGMRFAIYQTKVGLAYFLRKYKVDICEKTVIPYEADPTTFLLLPKSGNYLKVTKA